MLTGKMVRVRYGRDRLIPHYLDTTDEAWLEVAARLIELFETARGRTRGELEEAVTEAFGDDPTQLVHQGLAKLLEDRCEFEVDSGHPPEELREAAFRAAARARQADVKEGVAHFDRQAVLEEVAWSQGITPEAVDHGLFADLRSEQRLTKFQPISAPHLLERYNVGLAQAVFLRSTKVSVIVRHEPPQRYRQLLRLIKFHRLLCEVERIGPDSYQFHLDGPLSLFSATQKYGLQLALFLPAVLLCKNFEVRAELLWGPQRKPKKFSVSHADGLVSHYADHGMYVPVELSMFVELFRKRSENWDLVEEVELFPLGASLWAPDFRLVHRTTGQAVYLEVLGFWRRASAEKHLQWLRQYLHVPYLLAVSDGLHIADADLEGLPAGIHRFRNMPLPDEIERLADELAARLATSSPSPLAGEGRLLSPSPLAGEGQGGGDALPHAESTPPLPNPPPQGGREPEGLPRKGGGKKKAE